MSSLAERKARRQQRVRENLYPIDHHDHDRPWSITSPLTPARPRGHAAAADPAPCPQRKSISDTTSGFGAHDAHKRSQAKVRLDKSVAPLPFPQTDLTPRFIPLQQAATKAEVARQAADDAMRQAVDMEVIASTASCSPLPDTFFAFFSLQQSAACIQGVMQGREARQEHRRVTSAATIQATMRGHDARSNLFTHSYSGYLSRAEDESLPDRERAEVIDR